MVSRCNAAEREHGEEVAELAAGDFVTFEFINLLVVAIQLTASRSCAS